MLQVVTSIQAVERGVPGLDASAAVLCWGSWQHGRYSCGVWAVVGRAGVGAHRQQAAPPTVIDSIYAVHKMHCNERCRFQFMAWVCVGAQRRQYKPTNFGAIQTRSSSVMIGCSTSVVVRLWCKQQSSGLASRRAHHSLAP